MSEGELMGYEFFEHTADVGVRVYGKNLPELFNNAAKGLADLLVEQGAIQEAQRRPIVLTASSVEELLQRWLKELLFWFSVDRFLPASCLFDLISAQELKGVVRGDIFDLRRHAPGTEVKGVTRHQFSVELRDGRWEASVIFDV